MNQQSPWQPHRYRGWVLTILIIAFLAAIGFLCIEIAATTGTQSGSDTTTSPGILGSTSTALLFIVYLFILVLDARSFFTLFGKIQWKRRKGWQRVGIVFAYLCVVVMPAIYLVLALHYFLRVRHQTLRQALHGQWLWYRAKTRTAQLMIGIVCGLVIASIIVFTSVAASVDRQQALLLATPSPVAHQLVVSNSTQVTTTLVPSPVVDTPIPTPVHTATSTPTPTPTVHPKATPTARPTSPPQTPTPCPGINCNPWGYNFSPGNLIYYPPANFCSYFSCITSFQEPDDPGDGYIVQCADNLFSQSGGERGACSYHGGVQRPLYSH